MTVEELSIKYMREVKKYSSASDFETNAYRLSEALGVRVRSGERTSIIPGPPATIILEPRLLGSLSEDAIRHELGHVFLWWSKIEDELIEEFGCLELAMPMIEHLCDAAIGFLRTPQPMVNKAIKKHGVSAKAVLALQRAAKINTRQALKRVIYDNPFVECAGFISTSQYITEVVLCNASLPFWLADRIPEPELFYRASEGEFTFCKTSTPREMVGVFVSHG